MSSLLLIFSFVMGISIQASETQHRTEPAESNIVSFPENCLHKKENCGVKTFDTSYDIKMASSTVSMGPETSIVIINSKEIELVSGYIVLDVSEPKIKIISSALTISPQKGQVLVSRKKGEVSVDSLTAKVNIKGNYKNEKFELSPAYNFKFNGINSFSKYSIEFSQPVNHRVALQKWAKSFLGSRKDFLSKANKFRGHWKNATEEISETYKGIVERSIASNQAKLARRSARRKAYSDESQRLLNIFKNRNNLNLR